MYRFLSVFKNGIHPLYRNSTGKLLRANFSSEGVTVETKPFKLHKLKEGPPKTALLTKEEALRMYFKLYTIRKLDESCKWLYEANHFGGALHLTIGQEAVTVGIHEVMREQDTITPTYRAHGWVHLMGVDHLSFMGEIIGNRFGSARGKGGSMHMYYNEQFYGSNGIVGAQVPIGAGISLAKKYQGSDSVSFITYGDGAAYQGQIFETFNMAKLWNLPCVFVCENNHFARAVADKTTCADLNLYQRGDYIPGIFVDAMDVVSMREAAKFALNYCLSGSAPIVIEADTYLYWNRSIIDPDTVYRPREKVDDIRSRRDSLASLRKIILSNAFMTSEQVAMKERDIQDEVNEAVQEALQGEADMEELTSDIYAENLEGKIRNATPYNPLNHKRIGKMLER